MQQLATNIWTHEDITYLENGRELPLRLTAVRLANKKLWIHAPTPLSNALKTEINDIGDVGYLFCGNNLHNMFFMDWVYAYPQAEAWVTPGIPKKLSSLDNYDIFKENIWIEEFDTASMKEVPKFDETVFYHYDSKSLIVTDLVQNHGGKGIYLAPPLLTEGTIQDQSAFRDFINHIKVWDFHRIVVTHGDIVEGQAIKKFERICGLFS